MASQDIIDFMLGTKKSAAGSDSCDGGTSSGNGGRMGSSPRGGGPSRASASPRFLQTSPASSATSSTTTTTTKKVQSVAMAFAKTMVKDWLETDDTLHQVAQSIAGLRERLWQTSFALSAVREKEEPATWKTCGYRAASGGGGGGGGSSSEDDGLLTVDDLQLALDHDLRQHERMMATLRRCLSTLHQAQEALGRRLDEYYRLVDAARWKHGYIILSLEECQSLFVAAASELYRKQMMADEIFNSVHDRLLFRDDVRGSNELESSDPRRVARRCRDRWSRQHQESSLREDTAILEKLQKHIST